MGHQIIQQPDGRYAVWSPIVDDFVLVNAVPADIVQMEIEDYAHEVTRHVLRLIAELESGAKPYLQFTMTFETACAWARRVHGPEWKFLGDSEDSSDIVEGEIEENPP